MGWEERGATRRRLRMLGRPRADKSSRAVGLNVWTPITRYRSNKRRRKGAVRVGSRAEAPAAACFCSSFRRRTTSFHPPGTSPHPSVHRSSPSSSDSLRYERLGRLLGLRQRHIVVVPSVHCSTPSAPLRPRESPREGLPPGMRKPYPIAKSRQRPGSLLPSLLSPAIPQHRTHRSRIHREGRTRCQW